MDTEWPGNMRRGELTRCVYVGPAGSKCGVWRPCRTGVAVGGPLEGSPRNGTSACAEMFCEPVEPLQDERRGDTMDTDLGLVTGATGEFGILGTSLGLEGERGYIVPAL